MQPQPYRRIVIYLLFTLLLLAMVPAAAALTDKEALGKALFFDPNLSDPPGQSCASCHGVETGFTGPDSDINAAGAVYEGAVAGRFGNRKPPTVAYGAQSPILHLTKKLVFTGGMFWDGRATGERLGSPLADQAQGPFLNPLEQNLASPAAVCTIVDASSYAALFQQVWGHTCSSNVNAGYDEIGLSIAAYESSPEVNPYSSKFDASLKGKATLTQQERLGFALFKGKAQCSSCHTATKPKGSAGALFTDYTYDNLGIPKNEENPFYESSYNPLGEDWVDEGLGGYLASRPDYAAYSEMQNGTVKVPTLRNVDKRPSTGFIKAYGHNGYFKSLEEIVHFYNTRDVLATCSDPLAPQDNPGVNCWPAPEIPQNVNTAELGNLGLTANEEAAVVAFMKTLTDTYV